MRNGPRALNPNIFSLLAFCASRVLSLMNTMVKHMNIHQCSWHQDTLGRKSIINFVVLSLEHRPHVLDIPGKRGAELSINHHLKVSWICWKRMKRDILINEGLLVTSGQALCQGWIQLPPPAERHSDSRGDWRLGV